MSKAKTIIACMVALAILMVVQSAAAQGKLEGVWKMTELTTSGPNAQTIMVAQPSLFIFTKKHFCYATLEGEKPRPELPENATDAQKVATWTPFNAKAGTYEIKGTTFTGHGIVAKNPDLMKPGNFGIADFRAEGKTLLFTIKATDAGPVANPVTYKLVRLE